LRALCLEETLDQLDRRARPSDERVDVLEQRAAFLCTERFVDAAGNRSGAMDALPAVSRVTSCPYLRISTPRRAISGWEAITPTMLRLPTSASKSNSR
jgi:hypothetical protein